MHNHDVAALLGKAEEILLEEELRMAYEAMLHAAMKVYVTAWRHEHINPRDLAEVRALARRGVTSPPCGHEQCAASKAAVFDSLWPNGQWPEGS